MRLKLAAATMITALAIGPAMACDGPPVCTVQDPTTTDLNVRDGPNGKILMTLKDGQQVEVLEHREVKGQRWALVAKFEAAGAGWVFGSYVKCRPDGENVDLCTVKDPTGTPLNVREEPNGPIYGQFRNGVKVRKLDTKMHNGKEWILVERIPEDNVAGWVFDPYLKCEEDA